MATENSVLMDQAKESLKGKWGLTVKTTIVYLLVLIGIRIIPIIGFFTYLIFMGPLLFGYASFWLSLSRGQDPKLSDIFKGLNGPLGKYIITFILMGIYTLLWSLLFIIPGIIAAISYSQTFYILSENPDMDPDEAINKSKELMKGYKWKFFELNLRFIGWILLCFITLGIGLFWLWPYLETTRAKFYDDIKQKQADTPNSTSTPEVIPVVAEVI